MRSTVGRAPNDPHANEYFKQEKVGRKRRLVAFFFVFFFPFILPSPCRRSRLVGQGPGYFLPRLQMLLPELLISTAIPTRGNN